MRPQPEDRIGLVDSLCDPDWACVLSFAPEVLHVRHHPGKSVLTLRSGEVELRPSPPWARDILRLLRDPGVAAAQLALSASEAGPERLLQMDFLLGGLASRRLVRYVISERGADLARVDPLSPGFRLRMPPLPPLRPGQVFVLPLLTFCRRIDGRLTIESPGSPARATLLDPALAAIAGELLADGWRPDTAAAAGAATFARLLSGMGVLDCTSYGGTAGDGLAGYAWEFHELLFHVRSRRLDGSWRGRDHAAWPTSAGPPVDGTGGPAVPLCRPDIELLRVFDIPFTAVLEGRRSARAHGEPPITLEQLAEFLYRSARVTRVLPDVPGGLALRPFPTPGGLGALELFVVARSCAGLNGGIYRYDPAEHSLSPRSGYTDAAQCLLASAAEAAGNPENWPQVLIVTALKIGPLREKYGPIAYALALKEAGALFQTMYLVATAMGLAACALGSGDPETFAAVTGDADYTETSIGEFILGSPGREQT